MPISPGSRANSQNHDNAARSWSSISNVQIVSVTNAAALSIRKRAKVRKVQGFSEFTLPPVNRRAAMAGIPYRQGGGTSPGTGCKRLDRDGHAPHQLGRLGRPCLARELFQTLLDGS